MCIILSTAISKLTNSRQAKSGTSSMFKLDGVVLEYNMIYKKCLSILARNICSCLSTPTIKRLRHYPNRKGGP